MKKNLCFYILLLFSCNVLASIRFVGNCPQKPPPRRLGKRIYAKLWAVWIFTFLQGISTTQSDCGFFEAVVAKSSLYKTLKPRLGKRSFPPEAACNGFPKGSRSFGALFWFVFCRAAKNEHQNPTAAARPRAQWSRKKGTLPDDIIKHFSKTKKEEPKLSLFRY